MRLALPDPPEQYDRRDQEAVRGDIERAFGNVLVGGQDCEIGGGRIILRSTPGKKRFMLVCDDDGNLSTVPL